jgi:hypothetical protein
MNQVPFHQKQWHIVLSFLMMILLLLFLQKQSLADFLLANRRHMEQLEKEAADSEKQMQVLNNVFAEAMLTMGESIRMEDFFHKQPSLTECSIRDEREIPCVTLRYGFLFTITFNHGQMQVKPCSRTHDWQAVCQNKDYQAFCPLPLQEEQALRKA